MKLLGARLYLNNIFVDWNVLSAFLKPCHTNQGLLTQALTMWAPHSHRRSSHGEFLHHRWTGQSSHSYGSLSPARSSLSYGSCHPHKGKKLKCHFKIFSNFYQREKVKKKQKGTIDKIQKVLIYLGQNSTCPVSAYHDWLPNSTTVRAIRLEPGLQTGHTKRTTTPQRKGWCLGPSKREHKAWPCRCFHLLRQWLLLSLLSYRIRKSHNRIHIEKKCHLFQKQRLQTKNLEPQFLTQMSLNMIFF